MRKFFLLLISVCWLAGCSSSSNTTTSGVPPGPAPPPANPLVIGTQDASGVVAAVLRSVDVDLLVPVAIRVPGRASVPTLNPGSPNSCALAIASGVALSGAGLETSPLGGTVQTTQSGQTLTATFQGFNTLVAVITGTVQVTGTPESFQADFDQLQVDTKDGLFVLDGPAQYQRSGNTQVIWTGNYLLTLPQGTIGLSNFAVTSSLAAGNGAIAGSKSYQGDLVLNVLGRTGGLSVSTPAAVTFSGPFTGGLSELEVGSGTVTILGSEPLTLAAKNGEVAVTLAGSTVKTVPWAYLGGSIDAADLLRPLVADTLYTNGTFVTVDDANSQAEALASLDGRILAVGSAGAVQELVDASTRVVDLGGNTVLPGFVEPHIHVNLTALNNMSFVTRQVVDTGNYTGYNTIANAKGALTAALQAVPGAPGIFGYGFDPSRLQPPETMQPLTLQDLDEISSSIPVVVQNSSGHISYANSAAFRQTGIWPTAPNPPYTPPSDPSLASNIVVQNGLPTGQLNEDAQNPFIGATIGPILQQFPAEFVANYYGVLVEASRRGVTTACDQLTGGLQTLAQEEAIFAQLTRNHHPTVRLHSYVDSQSVDPLRSNIFAGEGDDSYRIVGAKFISDGSTQGLTAALNQDYRPEVFPFLPGGPRGALDLTTEQMFQQMSAWHDLGFQISTHANGDAAQDQVLGVYERLTPRPDARPLIHHFTVHNDQELAGQLARCRQLGVNVSFTIGHVFFWGEVFNNLILGPERAKNIDPTASCLAAGVPFSFHSDSPISPIDPLRYIQTGATRIWQLGIPQVLGPAELISVDQAIRAVTLDAARATKLEHKLGSLEVGKYTDLVVLGQNPRTVPPTQIAGIPVLATYVNGARIFQGP